MFGNGINAVISNYNVITYNIHSDFFVTEKKLNRK